MGLTVRKPSPTQSIWGMSVAVGAACLILYVLFIRDLGRPFPEATEVPWWIISGLWVAAEATAVHLRFRSNAHSFSLGEIPLTVGLFLTDPALFVIGQVIGVGLALRFHRRQPPIKFAFNLVNFFAQAVVALSVFHAIVPSGAGLGLRAWIAAGAAVAAALVLADALINCAIYLTGGKLTAGSITELFGLGLVASLMNASLGLVAVTILWWDPGSAWLAAVPPLILYVAYRAYTLQREDHDRLGSLYEATRRLHRSPQIESAMKVAVEQAKQLFQADLAEIVLMPGGREAGALSTFDPEGADRILVPLESDLSMTLWDEIVREDVAVLLQRRSKPDRGAAYFERRGIEDAIVAPLHVNGPAGAIVVANRLGDISTFGLEDLKLLETLAQHVSVSLENGRLEDSLEQVTRLKEELRHQALHDSLTGVANRTLFMERVEHALELNRRGGHGTAVLFVDLDDFKMINDTLGHAVGDELLKEVARRLRRCIRASDTPARLGGDEFAVLLEEFDDESDAVAAARRILVELETPFIAGHRQMPIGASVGVAIARPDASSEELLKHADLAMYIAKREGKGSYRVYEESTHSLVTSRLEMKSDLLGAVERGEFFIHYQPIVDLNDGSPVGVEALVRWDHPGRGIVMPEVFIPLAEESGAIVQLGRWVLEESCMRVASWQRALNLPLLLSVNVSARQLLEDTFIPDLEMSLKRSGLDPQHLVMELTESVLVPGVESAAASLSDIKDLGAQVAIDDFGTGYSSLSYLERYPIDCIKIDKSFVDSLSTGSEGGLARAVIEVSSSLGVGTVAEGIERTEQARRLLELGCSRGQGFLYSEPVAAEEVEAVLSGMRKLTFPTMDPVFDEFGSEGGPGRRGRTGPSTWESNTFTDVVSSMTARAGAGEPRVFDGGHRRP